MSKKRKFIVLSLIVVLFVSLFLIYKVSEYNITQLKEQQRETQMKELIAKEKAKQAEIDRKEKELLEKQRKEKIAKDKAEQEERQKHQLEEAKKRKEKALNDQSKRIFDEAKQQYPNIFGVLRTGSINQPLVQSKEMGEFLWCDANKNPNRFGTAAIFYENNGLNDFNTIIFAHNMHDKVSMFSPLVDGDRNSFNTLEIFNDKYTKANLVQSGVVTEAVMENIAGASKTAIPNITWEEQWTNNKPLEPNKKYITLSACYVLGGATRAIYIYEIENN